MYLLPICFMPLRTQNIVLWPFLGHLCLGHLLPYKILWLMQFLLVRLYVDFVSQCMVKLYIYSLLFKYILSNYKRVICLKIIYIYFCYKVLLVFLRSNLLKCYSDGQLPSFFLCPSIPSANFMREPIIISVSLSIFILVVFALWIFRLPHQLL